VETPSPRERSADALEHNNIGAPRVSAKGHGELAKEIFGVAQENNIPTQQSRGLTELLSTIVLGEEIPPALSRAIAEVLSFAYSLSGKSIRGLDTAKAFP
tara:strand:+ start:448 stop:747 length:300 start_codon:yes stop_codon:yes gene_type:complete